MSFKNLSWKYCHAKAKSSVIEILSHLNIDSFLKISFYQKMRFSLEFAVSDGGNGTIFTLVIYKNTYVSELVWGIRQNKIN